MGEHRYGPTSRVPSSSELQNLLRTRSNMDELMEEEVRVLNRARRNRRRGLHVGSTDMRRLQRALRTSSDLQDLMMEEVAVYSDEETRQRHLEDLIMEEVNMLDSDIRGRLLSRPSESGSPINPDINPNITARSNPSTHPEATDTNLELKCSICLDVLDAKYRLSSVLALECGHVFHENCISMWLGIKRECPVCKAAIA